MYSFNEKVLDNLKNRPELIPVMSGNDLAGFQEGEYPVGEDFTPLGNYPQEVVIATLDPESVIHQKVALIRAKLHISIKATQPGTTIYALPVDIIDELCKGNEGLQKYISDLRDQMLVFDDIRQ